MTPRSLIWLAMFTAVPSFGTAVAQSPSSPPRTFSLRIDNDAFDFWMLPWNRPDEDYTSGVHLDYDGGDAPAWARRLVPHRAECTARADRCRTARLELGQDIYTPSVDPSDPHAASTARPNAGWLYLAQTARALSISRADELSLTLGVTGPPSLARFTQRVAHDVAPAYNRPTDWTRQIAFEPGVIVRYQQERRISLAGVADLIPSGSISAGNVLTAADAGIRLRSGIQLQHPWLPQPLRSGVTIDAGISGQAVARDLFLDGNTFVSGPRVGHEPFVGTADAGLAVRFRRLSVEYRATTQTRAYAAGPKWHPWGSLIGRVTLGS